MVRLHALNTCKNEDQFKNEGDRVATSFLLLQVYVGFFQDAQGHVTQQSAIKLADI